MAAPSAQWTKRSMSSWLLLYWSVSSRHEEDDFITGNLFTMAGRLFSVEERTFVAVRGFLIEFARPCVFVDIHWRILNSLNLDLFVISKNVCHVTRRSVMKLSLSYYRREFIRGIIFILILIICIQILYCITITKIYF